MESGAVRTEILSPAAKVARLRRLFWFGRLVFTSAIAGRVVRTVVALPCMATVSVAVVGQEIVATAIAEGTGTSRTKANAP